jgi:AcrR family transcriptional regulator
MPRQDRSRALVDAIIEAAADILVRQGRDAVTTNAVAMRAGVSIGSVYQYFSNRQAILAAIAVNHLDRVHRSVANADLEGVNGLEDATTRIVGSLFAAHRIDPPLHLAIAREIGGSVCSHDAQYRPDAKAAVVALFEVAAPAVRDEILNEDLALAIRVAAEIAHVLAHAAIERSSDALTVCRLEHEAVRALLAYLGSGH